MVILGLWCTALAFGAQGSLPALEAGRTLDCLPPGSGGKAFQLAELPLSRTKKEPPAPLLWDERFRVATQIAGTVFRPLCGRIEAASLPAPRRAAALRMQTARSAQTKGPGRWKDPSPRRLTPPAGSLGRGWRPQPSQRSTLNMYPIIVHPVPFGKGKSFSPEEKFLRSLLPPAGREPAPTAHLQQGDAIGGQLYLAAGGQGRRDKVVGLIQNPD